MNKFIYIIIIVATSFVYSQKNYYISRDGDGDFLSISQLNSASLNPTDIVSFKSGQHFYDAILKCKKGIIYNTYGGSEKAIIGNASGNKSTTIQVDADNVTIENLKVYGEDDAPNIIGFSGKGLTIRNCEILGGNDPHIHPTRAIVQTNTDISATNLTIVNNTIYDIGVGIYISKPINVEISHNVLYDIWSINAVINGGGSAIRAGGTSNGDTWDCNYTFHVHHNEVYNWDYSVFAMGLSNMIIEYNEFHHNLDERIYRGGTKHGGIGKLWDNTSRTLGGLGLIFRYNYIHDLVRSGESGYTYKAQTEDNVRSGTFEILSTNNGSIYAWYELPKTSASHRESHGKYFGDQRLDDGTIHGENTDGVIGGLGYGNVWIHNNIFENCSNSLIQFGYTKWGKTYGNYREDLESYFINNTIINSGYLNYTTDYAGLILVDGNHQAPVTVVNNIIDFSSKDARMAVLVGEKTLLDYNIYLNQNGVAYDSKPSMGANKAAYFLGYTGGLNNWIKNNNVEHHEKYNTKPDWLYENENSIMFADNIGLNGTNIPDVRIYQGGNAFNKGISYSSLNNGVDGAGRSFAYDMLENLRKTNDIGAVGVSEYEIVIDPQSDSQIPVITGHPTNSSANLGNDVSFTVSTFSDDQTSYQWWKSPYVSQLESKIIDNEKYSGATTNTLTIINVTAEDASVQYLCEVYNSNDHANLWVNSNPASLTIAQSSGTSESDYLQIFLEAAYKNGQMETTLNSAKLFPKEHPYKNAPWNLTNNVEINDIKSNYVDWIIVELRKELPHATHSKPAILTNEGKVLNTDGTKFSFENIKNEKYYISIIHRNHLNVISSEKIDIRKDEPINYNFTDSPSKAYGINSLTEIGNGIFGMYAGDADANGVINNLDFGKVANHILNKGYLNYDLDMNGVINVLDYNKINKNIMKLSQLSR